MKTLVYIDLQIMSTTDFYPLIIIRDRRSTFARNESDLSESWHYARKQLDYVETTDIVYV